MDTRAEAGYAASGTTESTSGETTVTEAEWLACTEPAEMFRCIGWQPGIIRRKSPTFAYEVFRHGPAAAGAAAEAVPNEPPMQAALIRDLFGNPFRLVAISPAILAWHDSTVVRLAQAAYDERHVTAGTLDNTRLLILADALEEAGCADPDILTHLRGSGPHVRGCWVVDLLLGKP